MRSIYLLLLFAFTFSGLRNVQASSIEEATGLFVPGIIGLTTAMVGETQTYEYDEGALIFSPYWNVNTKGSIVSTWQSGTTYYVSIAWTGGTGTGTVYFYEDGGSSLLASKNVTVNPLPTPATTFTTTQKCSSTVVKRTTSPSPSASYEWWWQTSATGTVTTLGKADSVVRTTAGSLFLRARTKLSPYTWSTAQSIGSITVITTPPAAPATSTDGHVITSASAQVPLSVSAVSGATAYWWYTQPSGGTAVSGQTTVSYSPSVAQTITYYVAAVQQACPSSTRKAVTGYVHPAPTITSTNGGLVSMGNAVTLSVPNYTYDTYQWIDGSGNNISGATSSTYVTSKKGTYKVKVTKATATAFTSLTGYPVSGGLDGLNMNYIISNTTLREISDEARIDELPVDSITQTIQYFDGLGRPIQTVVTQGSPNKKDIVQPVMYDQFGRERLKYLPVAPNSNSGWYKSGIIDGNGNYTGVAAGFYTNNPTGKIADDAKPLSETIFEASPLNRPVKDYGAGQQWSTTGNNKFIERQYLVNVHGTGASTNAEKVIAWTLDGTGMPIRCATLTNYVEAGGYYSTGKLQVHKTIDEQQNAVREYTNAQGKVVLKKVQVVAGSSNLNHTDEWALTYYIYDNLGNLRFVFPPELSKIIHDNVDTRLVTPTDLDNWAFQYKYDADNRMSHKQVPGAAITYLVYDNLDRLVMTQDGNQRVSNQWSFTKYDVLNRPVLTGIYTHGSTVDQAGMSLLISTTNFYETYNGNSSTHGYTNALFPTSGTILTATYYDNYNFKLMTSGLDYVSSDLTGQPTAAFMNVRGQVTGTKINILGSSYLYSVSYFDDKYRAIQTIAQNHKSGTDRVTNNLDFSGKVLETKRTYVVNGVTSTVKETFTYDHAGRVLTVKHSTNGATDVMLVKNEYNELGQLVDKKLHSEDNGSTFKQSVDYRYNIRGWLTSMNNASLTSDAGATNDDATDYFGMNLSYNTVDTDLANTALYNGNISAMKWSNYPGTGTTMQKGYTYTYDAMNRIGSSTFKEKTSSWAAAANNGFSETGYKYDLNGNIKNMQRNDKRGSGWMDNMTYDYGTGTARSNKLVYVSDAGDPTAGFVDGNVGTATDYTYDNNGNMTRDLNKGIGSSVSDMTNLITYNFLNLPETVTKGGNTIRYVYDATGRKLSQLVITGATQKQTDYVGEFTYENDALQFISHAEGRVMMSSNKLIYTNTYDVTPTDVTTLGATLSTHAANGQKYIKVVSSNTTPGNGLSTIGGTSGTFTVAAGDRYRVRAKGYRSTNTVNLQVKAGATVLGTTTLPNNSTNESWVEQIVTIPASTTTMQVGLVWGAAPTAGEAFYLNEIEVTKLTTSTPEYQYNLKDHLGNVRLTFTSRTTTSSYTAGFETANQSAEAAKFPNYPSGGGQINTQSVNATTGTNSQVLNGGYAGQIGLAKSFSVMPGDVVSIQAYAKYSTPSSTPTDYNSFVTSLLSAFSLSAPVGGETGTASWGVSAFGSGEITALGNGGRPDAVKIFVTIFIFDRNYNLLDVTYHASTSSGALMSKSYTVREPGYAYLYVSNEHPTQVSAYLDDITISHTPSAVIQVDDYYPFGLIFNSYRRENSVENKIKLQEQEHIDDLNLGWDSFKWRNNQSDIGRFFNVDPLAEKYFYNSPYAFAENRVVDGRELEGLEWFGVNTAGAMAISSAFGGEEHTSEELKQIQDGETKGLAEGGKAGAPIVIASLLAPEVAIPFMIGSITGLPVTPSPQAMAGSTFQTLQAIESSSTELSTEANFTGQVVTAAKSMNADGKNVAAVVGAELNGARTIASSGPAPSTVAPSLENAANTIGGVGAVRGGTTVGCCAEFRAANQLLLENPTFAPDAVKFTPAIRPRTGQVVPPCQNCKDLFKQLQ